MKTSSQREKVLEEIDQVQDANLGDLFELLHKFRLASANSGKTAASVMRFASCWADFDDDLFNDFQSDVAVRRREAFARRRVVESGAN